MNGLIEESPLLVVILAGLMIVLDLVGLCIDLSYNEFDWSTLAHLLLAIALGISAWRQYKKQKNNK